MAARHGFGRTPPTAQIFGNAAREHMETYGTTEAQLAAVGAKNHRHSVHNPYAQFQDAYTVDEVLAARTVHRPLTKLHSARRPRTVRPPRSSSRSGSWSGTAWRSVPWRSSPRP